MARVKKSSNVLIVFVVCLIFLAIETIIFYEKISAAQEEREAMREVAKQRAEKLQALEEQLEYYKSYVDRVIGDPEFMEREMRSRLGYVQEGEVVIREEETPRNPRR